MALGIVIAAVLLYYLTGFSLLNVNYICIFNLRTGLPCPGCGATRSLRELVAGRVLMSIYDYPPIVYSIVVYLIFMIRCVLYKFFGIRKSADGTILIYFYIGLGLIVVQWVVKLAAWFIWGYEWIK